MCGKLLYYDIKHSEIWCEQLKHETKLDKFVFVNYYIRYFDNAAYNFYETIQWHCIIVC